MYREAFSFFAVVEPSNVTSRTLLSSAHLPRKKKRAAMMQLPQKRFDVFSIYDDSNTFLAARQVVRYPQKMLEWLAFLCIV